MVMLKHSFRSIFPKNLFEFLQLNMIPITSQNCFTVEGKEWYLKRRGLRKKKKKKSEGGKGKQPKETKVSQSPQYIRTRSHFLIFPSRAPPCCLRACCVYANVEGRRCQLSVTILMLIRLSSGHWAHKTGLGRCERVCVCTWRCEGISWVIFTSLTCSRAVINLG